MTWRQFVRAVQADQRRHHREAERYQRALQLAATREDKAMRAAATRAAKYAALSRANDEAQLFESYLELLVSLHIGCSGPWDWRSIASEAPPPEPIPRHAHEEVAARDLARYQPGLVERLLGPAKERREELQRALHAAQLRDQSEHAEEVKGYQYVLAQWGVRRELAPAMLARDASAYPRALYHADAFGELVRFGTAVSVEAVDADVIAVRCDFENEELVPNEEVKLTASGKVSRKAMATGRWWALYQDHLCSCAIRIAREAFAVLPVSRAITNLGALQVNSSTGHKERVTFIAAHFVRADLAKINVSAIDPSDAMSNFQHRMKFKKTAGFTPVEPIATTDQWASTS